ncbi:MAG TPA: cytidylate kinase family protein, partial [Candidatus Methylomirabilis sp.]|nr:cytidylate kinase family protein [Candidatus Methylomirabilis sp.]
LSKALGSPCIGREILVDAAAKLGVPEPVLARKMEKGPGFWERLTLERRMYVVAVQAALAEHVEKGDLVYHGLAGHMLLRGLPAVLRVRLIAPIEARIQAVMERQGLGREAALHFIHDIDENRVRWTKFMYSADLTDPQLYDLVINLERMSIATACAIVVEAAGRQEFVVTQNVRAKLASFALACRVKVALATHPSSRGLDLEVSTEEGVVTITGEVPKTIMLTHASSRWEQELTQVAKSVPGTQRVELGIREFDAYH